MLRCTCAIPSLRDSCASPAGASLPAGSGLYLSLNGQNFVAATVAPATDPLPFFYLPVLAPYAISPSSGPSLGATVVTVSTIGNGTLSDAP